THHYTTHVRELSSLLWRSLSTSEGGSLELTRAVRAELRAREAPVGSRELTREVIQAALDQHGGVQAKAWRALGLPNRHVLRRLMVKLNIRGAPEEEDDTNDGP